MQKTEFQPSGPCLKTVESLINENQNKLVHEKPQNLLLKMSVVSQFQKNHIKWINLDRSSPRRGYYEPLSEFITLLDKFKKEPFNDSLKHLIYKVSMRAGLEFYIKTQDYRYRYKLLDEDYPREFIKYQNQFEDIQKIFKNLSDILRNDTNNQFLNPIQQETMNKLCSILEKPIQNYHEVEKDYPDTIFQLCSLLEFYVETNKAKIDDKLYQSKAKYFKKIYSHSSLQNSVPHWNGDYHYSKKPIKVNKYWTLYCKTKGLRPKMEDYTLIKEGSLKNGKTLSIFGVFDGHKGKKTAKYFCDNLADELIKKLNLVETQDVQSIYRICKFLTPQMNFNRMKQINDYSGSTVLFAFILDEKLWVVNTGDSRALLIKGDKWIEMSEDQKPDNLRFIKGVYQRNGETTQKQNDVTRVNGELAMTRAVGPFIVGISPRSKIRWLNLKDLNPSEKNYLFLCSDGMFEQDDITNNQFATYAYHHSLVKAVLDLPKYALHKYYDRNIYRGSEDNISVIGINLIPNAPKPKIPKLRIKKINTVKKQNKEFNSPRLLTRISQKSSVNSSNLSGHT